MTTTETSLRVRFAKAMGHDTAWCEKWLKMTTNKGEELQEAVIGLSQLPDPIDANTVREALMGMTEEEWKRFTMLFFDSRHFECVVESDFKKSIEFYQHIMTQCFKQEPPILAEIYCEVKLS